MRSNRLGRLALPSLGALAVREPLGDSEGQGRPSSSPLPMATMAFVVVRTVLNGLLVRFRVLFGMSRHVRGRLPPHLGRRIPISAPTHG
jgi:hypothetical protein